MDLLQHQTMAETLVPSLFVADPQTVGACRIDMRSDDAEHRARMKNAFCADASEADSSSALASAHCDEPAGVMLAPTRTTAERFGRGCRGIIFDALKTGRSRSRRRISWSPPPTAPRGGQTQVHTLAASHFPFYSQTMALADILLAVAA
jgi:hypothetical protein